ncbi:STAS domain-containing protein [Actinomadura atramentaria]|uniref:STAS domain-containing protein n=1 Tax=Actinomadura atramentaria TaxID=1990 RepID=UPI00036CBD7F|nr:STAS domain-containing protein [Actinomadura atramentaria]
MAEDNTTAERRPTRRGPGVVRCSAGASAPGPVMRYERRRTDLAVTAERAPGGVTVAAVTGEIDLHTADTLRARLASLHAAGDRGLVVDFEGVPFCDATGLGALVAAHNEIAARGGGIRLARMRPAQERLVRITGLHRLFPVHATVDEAVAAAAQPLS